MYLITHSLLSAWMNYLDETYNDAREQFEGMLRKERFVPKPAMRRGLEFEEQVMRYCFAAAKGVESQIVEELERLEYDDEYIAVIREVAGLVEGGSWQVKASKKIQVQGVDFLLYGRCDVLRGNEIIDLKWTDNESNYKMGKFQGSTQHPMYYEIFPGTDKFRYITSGGYSVIEESYRREDSESIIPSVYMFWDWLGQFQDYKKTFTEKWTAFGS